MAQLQIAIALALVALLPVEPGWLGIVLSQDGPLTVAEVIPDSPAEQAGLLPGDELRAIDGNPVTTMDAFLSVFEACRPEQAIVLSMIREGQPWSVRITLGYRPGSDVPAARRTKRVEGKPGAPATETGGVPEPAADHLERALTSAAAAGRPVLLRFHATWCGPCRQLDETFEQRGVRDAVAPFVQVSVDIDEDPDVAARYGIQAVPALVVIPAGGGDGDRLVGAVEAETLTAWLSARSGKAPSSNDNPLADVRKELRELRQEVRELRKLLLELKRDRR